MNKRNIYLSITTLLVVGLTFVSCLDEENQYTQGLGVLPPTTTKLTATLNGASEKPASTTSTATGTFAGVLDNNTRVLSYTVTYQGLTPTAGHLHRITKADGSGPVDIPFPPSLTSPIIATTAALPQTKVDSMLNGFYYANLHTVAYPGGEIRGDIKKQ